METKVFYITSILLASLGVLLSDPVSDEVPEEVIYTIRIEGSIHQGIQFIHDIEDPFREIFSQCLTSHCKGSQCASAENNEGYSQDDIHTSQRIFKSDYADYSFYVQKNSIDGSHFVSKYIVEDVLTKNYLDISGQIKHQFAILEESITNDIQGNTVQDFSTTQFATTITSQETSTRESTLVELTTVETSSSAISSPTSSESSPTTSDSSSTSSESSSTSSESYSTSSESYSTSSESSPTSSESSSTTSESSMSTMSSSTISLETVTDELTKFTSEISSESTVTGTTSFVTEDQQTTVSEDPQGTTLESWEIALITIGCLAAVSLAGGFTYYSTKKRQNPFDRLRGYSDIGDDEEDQEGGSRSLNFHNAAYTEEAHFDMNSVSNQNME